MREGLNRLVPAAYRLLHVDAWTRTRAGERIFLAAFFAYKRWIEDPHAAFAKCHPDVFEGGHVLDVGANAGYTACVFARAISPGFRVYAFEPEERNFARLERVIASHELRGRVVAVRTAAGDDDGSVALRRNPAHPGDHHIVSAAAPGDVRVPIVRLDTYVEANSVAPVKFVKIDVQGQELAVSRGMSALVDRHRGLEVSFEYSGAESEEVVRWYDERGFAMHVMQHNGTLVPFTAATIADAMRARGYADVFATRRKVL